MIELRRSAAVLPRHPRRQQRDPKAKLAQQSRESTIQFVAEPTPAQVDDLVEEALQVAGDVAAKRDIEIFERNGVQMGKMQSAQRLCSGISGTGVADAREVGFGIEHGNSVAGRQSLVINL